MYKSSFCLEATNPTPKESMLRRRLVSNERKSLHPKSTGRLSDKEVREELAKAEKLYVLGINSAHVKQALRAVELRFGESPKVVVGAPNTTPALLVKMSFPKRGVINARMTFFVV